MSAMSVDPWREGLPFDLLGAVGCESVSAMDLYTDVFRLGTGLIQRNGEIGSLKANPIAYYRNDSSASGHFRIMFEDDFEDLLGTLQDADFSILNGITYFGRKNEQSHASKMYALIFDLDGVDEKKLETFFRQCSVGFIPSPNYIVFSGHGLHLYYVFQKPLPLFPNIKLQLKDLKYGLTRRIWNQYTSTIKEPQYQGINQGFRVAGGRTKSGCSFPRSLIFRYRKELFELEELNKFVPDEQKIDASKLFRETKYTLNDAKEKFPDWYERVVLNHDRSVKKWDIAGKVHGDNPYALYDWWYRQIMSGVTYGHRYFCIMVLTIYAVKCDVPKERLEKDAMDLIDYLSSIGDAPFTQSDVLSALECYDDRYCTFPLKDIIKLSAIEIPRNKRNYQKQSYHLEEARAIRDIRQRRKGTDWRDNNGRPSKKQIVWDWMYEHPFDSKSKCRSDTGLTYPTIRKWWDECQREVFHRMDEEALEFCMESKYTKEDVECILSDADDMEKEGGSDEQNN